MTAPTAAGSEPEPGALPVRRIPGYLIRRAEQVHNALWAAHVGFDVTSPQYAVLATLAAQPDLSQARLGELASLDKSSVADVVGRLVDREWVERTSDPLDARRRRLRLGGRATTALERLTPDAAHVQERLLAPPPPAERGPFVDRLRRISRFEHGPDGAGSPVAPPVLGLEVPGHLIRCAQQVHTALWLRTFGTELTGPQYAILHILARQPDLSQRELGELAALDRSTVAELVVRLQRRGWLVRHRNPADGRGKLVRLADQVAVSMPWFAAGMAAVQRQLVAPLGSAGREEFIAQLACVAFAGALPSDDAVRFDDAVRSVD